MTRTLKLWAFAVVFPLIPASAAAASCSFDVYAVATTQPVKNAAKARATATGFSAQVESASGHWLKGLSPAALKVTEKGAVYQIYGMRFEINDEKMCHEGLLIKLSGSCRHDALVNNSKYGTSMPFEVWLTGPRTPSQARQFQAEVCR